MIGCLLCWLSAHLLSDLLLALPLTPTFPGSLANWLLCRLSLWEALLADWKNIGSSSPSVFALGSISPCLRPCVYLTSIKQPYFWLLGTYSHLPPALREAAASSSFPVCFFSSTNTLITNAFYWTAWYWPHFSNSFSDCLPTDTPTVAWPI